jgi:hypothetical protein
VEIDSSKCFVVFGKWKYDREGIIVRKFCCSLGMVEKHMHIPRKKKSPSPVRVFHDGIGGYSIPQIFYLLRKPSLRFQCCLSVM